MSMVKCELNGKYQMILPEHRANRPEWYTDKGWERQRIDSLHEHLTKNDILFYVGAEEGDIAGLCAKWVDNVFLFEPNDRVWPNIKAIWEANNLPVPYCYAGFASDKTTGNQNFVRGFPFCADGEIISDHGFKELSDPHGIPQIRIDDISIVPTAITLDVEGSEWLVLRGAYQVLRQHHPKIWLSGHPEFMLTQYNMWLGELRKWIRDMGYKEELLAYDHEVHLYYE